MSSAIFVAADLNYARYANILLNSLDACGVGIPVHLQSYEIPEDHPWLRKVAEPGTFGFPVHVAPVVKADFDAELERYVAAIGRPPSRNHLVKTLRMRYLKDIGSRYSAVCLADADLCITSPDFGHLFDFVEDSGRIVGVNENFKWNIGPEFSLDGQPLFPEPRRELSKFHCSVPLFMDMRRCGEIFDEYYRIFYGGKQLRNGKTEDIGDMMSYNIAVARCGREKDVFLLPPQQFTQVHQMGYLPWCRLAGAQGRLRAKPGHEVVYSLHGRALNPGWRPSVENNVRKLLTMGGFVETKAAQDWMAVELPRLMDFTAGTYRQMAQGHKVDERQYGIGKE